MAFQESIKTPGENKVDSLDGTISLDESQARLVVIDPVTQKEITVINKDGLRVSNGTNIIALLGYDSMGNIAVKVAKEGYDATTASDDQLIFNSQQNVLKVVLTGTATITVPSSPNDLYLTSVPHPLGYAPALISYLISPDGSISQMPITSMVRATPNNVVGTIWGQVSATDVTFYINTNSSLLVGTHQFKYYLLQETAI